MSTSRTAVSRRALLGAVLLLAFGPQLHAQELRGRILEQTTDRPVDLALIELVTREGRVVAEGLTDRSGRFSVRAPEPGDFLLRASGIGFATRTAGLFELGEESWMEVEFRIPQAAIEIGGLVIEGDSPLRMPSQLEANGFVERARQGFGRFLTPVDIERSHAYSTTSLLEETGRVQVRPSANGMVMNVLMRSVWGLCSPSVYVDGIRFRLRGMSLESVVPKVIIQAVEVYDSPAEAPLQYAGGMMNGCGVILFWTGPRRVRS